MNKQQVKQTKEKTLYKRLKKPLKFPGEVNIFCTNHFFSVCLQNFSVGSFAGLMNWWIGEYWGDGHLTLKSLSNFLAVFPSEFRQWSLCSISHSLFSLLWTRGDSLMFYWSFFEVDWGFWMWMKRNIEELFINAYFGCSSSMAIIIVWSTGKIEIGWDCRGL